MGEGGWEFGGGIFNQLSTKQGSREARGYSDRDGRLVAWLFAGHSTSNYGLFLVLRGFLRAIQQINVAHRQLGWLETMNLKVRVVVERLFRAIQQLNMVFLEPVEGWVSWKLWI